MGEISLLHVHPDHRRQGGGEALFNAVREHLAQLRVRRVRVWATQESLSFARRHGFEPGRQARYSILELRHLEPHGPAPAGVLLVPVAQLDDRSLPSSPASLR